MKARRVERLVLTAVFVLFGFTLWRWAGRGPIPRARSVVFVPGGLLVLSALNFHLRAKGLAWGVFSLAFILCLIVVGTWVVTDRASAGSPTMDFFRASALYGVLAAAALFQLRVGSSERG